MSNVGVFLLVLFAYQGQCQFLSHFDFGAVPDDNLHQVWNWRSNPGVVWPGGRPDRRDVEETTFRDREPLGPDFHDPEPLPGAGGPPDTGVIDVEASGVPSGFPSGFPEIPDNSGFPNYGGNFPGIFNIFGSFRTQSPWWNGPHVCIEREETTENEDGVENVKAKNNTDVEEDYGSSFLSTINLSSCHETPDKYECVTKTSHRGVMKSFTVKYKCCYGYQRLKNAPGCTKVDLKNLVDTIKELDNVEFMKMISSTQLTATLREGNYTVFVPNDKALSEFAEQMIEMNQVEIARRKRDIQNALSSKDLCLNHIVPGFADLTEIDNEQVLSCELKESSIRMNIYPTSSGEKLITANCVPVRKANVLTENGIVHVIDGVIPPSMNTIKEIVEKSDKLKMLRKVLNNPNLETVLERKGPFTFLAPTDGAFDKLDKETREKLMNGDACAINILKYHIIPHSVCSSAINGNVTTHNIEGYMFNLERKEDDTLVIDDKLKIEKSDIIAKNGVIHLVDTILLPDSGLHLTQILKKHGYTKFDKLVKSIDGLADTLNSLENATFFIPNDSAFTDEVMDIIGGENGLSNEAIVGLVKYHMIPNKIQSCDFNNNEMVNTGVEEKARINLYSTLPIFTNLVNRATVNCAKLVDFDKNSCGSVIHVIDKVLIPPSESIYEIITNNQNYSILAKIIKGTDIEKTLKNQSLSITFLAPTNVYLEEISDKELNVLLEDKEKANEILNNHILTEVICCSGVGSTPWNFNSYVQTMGSESKEIGRNNRHQVRIGKSTVTKCDIMATNGVIHEVNKVMFPVKRTYNFPDLGLFLFDL